jgi:putative membrane protein
MTKLGAFVVAMALVATGASAQPPGSRQTRDFVQAAAQSDKFEILEATTALAQSRNPQVRSFAQAMIEAHRQASADLRQAVTRAGLEQPNPGVSGDQSAFLAALQSARGGDFDTLYIRQQILAHHAALAVEQGYAGSGDDPAIRQVAVSAVPVISVHLQMADQIHFGTGS